MDDLICWLDLLPLRLVWKMEAGSKLGPRNIRWTDPATARRWMDGRTIPWAARKAVENVVVGAVLSRCDAARTRPNAWRDFVRYAPRPVVVWIFPLAFFWGTDQATVVGGGIACFEAADSRTSFFGCVVHSDCHCACQWPNRHWLKKNQCRARPLERHHHHHCHHAGSSVRQ